MIYARISNGLVSELFTPPTGVAITDCFHTGLDWVDVTAVTPAPHPGWTYDGTAFAAPVVPTAPAPTLEQQVVALIAGGLTIVSTGTPALNGVYTCSASTTDHLQSEIISIIVTGTFADGGATVAWPDVDGAMHVFPSVDEFKAFAIAVGKFVAGCAKVVNGSSTTLPPATATIP